jgi:hypothetical protein
MEKYLIELQTKVNGKFQKGYHENITESTRKDTMNVYVEWVTFDKRKAKRFYDKEEAQRFAILFTRENLQTATVIPVKK